MKAGNVVLIGRTNAGKSTLLNRLVGQKVAITSKKPNTTRFTIQAVYEDNRGQIVFTDTPGVSSKKPSLPPPEVAVYLVDHTRYRDSEENQALGLVRKIQNAPKILVFNKWDLQKKSYYPEYRFLEEEFDKTLKISALKGTNINKFLETIFSYLPETNKPLVNTKDLTSPLLNMDSKTFLAELIREKAFKYLGKELPYKISVKVNEVADKKDKTLYIKADIISLEKRHKSMIIGKRGQKIKQIGTAARKELELARGGKKVYLDLRVLVNPNYTI